MRAPALVGIVTALHIIGITALVSIQGCGTTRTTRVTPLPVEQPPPPTMPPKASQPPKTASIFTRPAVTTPTPAVDTANLVGTTYTIKKGDTLSHVAKRHGVGTRDLAEYNGITNLNSLKVGQKLVIPPYAKGPSSGSASSAPRATSTPAPRAAAASAVAGSGAYVVQAGDNLSKIAKRQGTSVSALKQVNKLSSDRILVGQKLVLPKGIGSSAAAMTSVRSTPRVTPSAPAVRSVTEAVDASSLDLDTLGIQSIEVPRDRGAGSINAGSAVSIPAIQDKPILYTVVDGDSVDEIAKLFIVSKSEILQLNNLAAGAELKPGQTIRIPPSAL